MAYWSDHASEPHNTTAPKGPQMEAHENSAAVVAAYEAFGRGDVTSVVAMNTPDAVWMIHTSPAAPYNGERKGLESIGALFGIISDTVDITQFHMAPIASEGDVVVAVGRQTYTVKRTGKTASGAMVHVFTFNSDGKVTRFEEWEGDVHDAWT